MKSLPIPVNPEMRSLPKIMPVRLDNKITVPATIILDDITTEINVNIEIPSRYTPRMRNLFSLESPLILRCDLDLSEVKSNVDQICLIRSGSTNKYRIDHTNHPNQLLNELQRGSPYILKIIAACYGNTNLHKQYQYLYKEREYIKGWFDFEDTEIRSIKESFIKHRFSRDSSPVLNGEFGKDSNDRITKNKDSLILGSNLDRNIICGIVQEDKIIVGSDKIIRVWDLKNNICDRLIGHSKDVTCLASSYNLIFSGSDDCTIRVWNIKNKICNLVLIGHGLSVNKLMVLSNNKLVSASNDKTLRIWNLENGLCENVLKGHENKIRCLNSLSDNTIVSASYDNNIKLWTDGDCIKTLTGHSQGITSLIVLPDDTIVSGSYDKSIKIWKNNQCTDVLEEHKYVVTCLTYIDNLIISGSYDGMIKIYNIQEKKYTNIIIIDDDDKITFLTADKQYIYCGLYNGHIKIYDLHTFECIKTLSGHSNPILSIDILPDERIVSKSTGATIRIWNK